MPEEQQPVNTQSADNSLQSSVFSPLPPSSSENSTSLAAKDPSGNGSSKKTLFVASVLVVVMVGLVGAAYYSLRSGSSAPAPTSPPTAAVNPLSDQGLDQSVSSVNSDFSSIDKEVSGADSGLNDSAGDLTY